MNQKTIQVDRKHALQTLLVAIKAEIGVNATGDLPDEPGSADGRQALKDALKMPPGVETLRVGVAALDPSVPATSLDVCCMERQSSGTCVRVTSAFHLSSFLLLCSLASTRTTIYCSSFMDGCLFQHCVRNQTFFCVMVCTTHHYQDSLPVHLANMAEEEVVELVVGNSSGMCHAGFCW